MKKRVIVLFVLITKSSFCMDLRNKRQADMKSESDLDDRYGWDRPSIRRQWPTTNDNINSSQWPNSNQRPSSPKQKEFTINRPSPIDGTFSLGRFLPNQGRYPFGGTFTNQGRYPYGGTFPNQGRFPDGRPYPNQGRFPIGGRFPNQDRFPYFPTKKPTTQKPTEASTTPADDSSIKDCLQNCPVTSEYNPVCGTNNVTYANPGRLMCAQACGISVKLFRSSPCPSTATIAPV